MKTFIFSLFFCPIFFASSLFGHFEDAKQEIKDLKFKAKVNSIFVGYEAYTAAGQYEGYRYALLVIAKWERIFQSKKPPIHRLKDDILVLMSLSNEEAHQGFDTVEESWQSQGFRSSLSRSLSIIKGKPFIEDGVFH